MRAVHFVRSRQEERELAWWLSFTAYDLRDRSLNNRIYLVYVILFFGVWTFVTLTLFASGGAIVLTLINPLNPVGAAVFIMVAWFCIWTVYGIWRSQQRSPVIFSEQDAYLICQTPINPRDVTLRWLPMPWLKSTVPFWLGAITLGFSIAEVVMAGAATPSRLIEYVGYGFRAWLIVLPVHLGLFALQWAAGIYRLHKNDLRRWFAWVVIPISIVLFTGLTVSAFSSALVSPNQISLNPVPGVFVERAASELLSTFSTLMPFWIFALATLGLMVLVLGGFNLSRAAEETGKAELISSANRYGFAAYAEQLRSEQRLRGVHASPRLPMPAGAGILVWKDVLQSLRSLSLGLVFRWVLILIISAGYTFLPDPGSRALAAAFWMIQIGQAAVIRLRSDLSRWALVRQLAIPPKDFVLFELAPAYGLSVAISLIGLILSAVISTLKIDRIVFLVPGIVAGVVGMAAFDVIRRSRSDLLMTGSAPGISAGGMILALIVGAVPWLIATFVSGWIGLAVAVPVSLGLGWLTFNLATFSFQKINGG